MSQALGIDFRLEGWTAIHSDEFEPNENTLRGWRNDLADRTTLHRFDSESPLTAPLTDIDTIRRHYREAMTADTITVVSVDSVRIDTVLVVRTILKFWSDPHGLSYVGSYNFPFRDFSLVIRVVCRDSRNSESLNNTIDTADGKVAEDCTDPTWASSAEFEYFGTWPEHPLSRLRAALTSIATSCKLDDALKQSGPSSSPDE